MGKSGGRVKLRAERRKQLAGGGKSCYNAGRMSPTAPADTRAREASRRPEGTRPVVPDHDIVRIIGSGAYGEVWLARSVTGAYRAVKVVWREDFAEEALFIREFEGVLNYEPIARDIPGLVHILHVGQNRGENPHYFYVMELADDAYTGIHLDPEAYVPRTLQSDIQQYGKRAMPLDYVLEVGCQLARALEALHAEGLAHRDVKPSNIIFVNGRAKLADAGLVATSHQRAFVGTEGYIPPEGPGTPRADVYALAKVLYEMGTGMDRLSFPALPEELPEGTAHRRWLQFNNLICRAAEPRVGKNSIASAQLFAEQLEQLRDDVPRLRRRKRKKEKAGAATTASSRRKFLIAGGVLVLLAAAGGSLLPEDTGKRLQQAYAALLGEPAEPPPPAETKPIQPRPTGEGQLFIGSVPSAASVYTASGEYLDETPYGPITLKSGRSVAFILRKDGFADTYVSGIIPDNKMLSLAPELRPYRPPKTGHPWKDALGTIYSPAGGLHQADSPVTAAHFTRFLQQKPAAAERFRYEINGEFIRTSREAISAYTLWLTGLCEEAGTIGRDHSLTARPEPGTESGSDMCGYRLSTTLVHKTPISIYSNPAGASVSLNGLPLGVTPMQDVRVPLSPYFLEIRLPGYSTERRSGLSPQDLVLNLNLKPNHSLIFGTGWINSLGMKFHPVSPTLMACTTEVRVSDYREYCNSTGAPIPEHPSFEQNEHHPVVFVSRHDAEAFAAWLTESERANGLLEKSDTYRLPTDKEWSMLVGCPPEQGNSPYDRHRHHVTASTTYPWGSVWPPSRGAGNYADMSALGARPTGHILPHYRDGFTYTAPVGSFEPNALGLHDLSGNVQEWVSDSYGGPADFQFRNYGVTRGGDYNSFRPGQLSSHSRIPYPPVMKRAGIGFRLVLERKQENLAEAESSSVTDRNPPPAPYNEAT